LRKKTGVVKVKIEGEGPGKGRRSLREREEGG